MFSTKPTRDKFNTGVREVMMDSITVAAADSGGSELCRDLIREILLKLPVKALVRFKQVSKTWMRIIKSNRFASEHYRYLTAKTRSGVHASFYVVRSKWSRVSAHRYKNLRIASSVYVKRDGHECLIHENISLPCFPKYGAGLVTYSEMFPAGFGLYCVSVDSKHRAALWNPATREVKEFPRSPFFHNAARDFVWIFAFARVAYQDGVFSYKVGLLTCRCGMTGRRRDWPNLELHLYSSSTASWRLITAPRSAFPRGLPCRGVNLKDAVHILSWDDDAEDYHIMTFDYGREEFGRIGLPDAPQLRQYEPQRRALLTLFDDQFLCLIFPWVIEEEEEREKPDMFVDVWVMREYGVEGSWSKECTKGPVSDHMSLARNYSKSLGGMFLESWERGRGVFKLSESRDSSELYIYDCASSAVENLSVGSDGWTDIQVLDRTDSLVRIGRPKFQWKKL